MCPRKLNKCKSSFLLHFFFLSYIIQKLRPSHLPPFEIDIGWDIFFKTEQSCVVSQDVSAPVSHLGV